jgi:hypothetical protein
MLPRVRRFVEKTKSWVCVCLLLQYHYTPIKGAYNTQQYPNMPHTPTKINNYSRSITEARTRSSGGVQHRSLQSLHDVDMAPDSLLDLPSVRSPHC